MYNERRQKLKSIFEDTMRIIRSDGPRSSRTEESVAATRLYAMEQIPSLPARKGEKPVVKVTRSRSFEAAMRILKEHPEWRVGVLNFASATNPGGGVKEGSGAQEECLCRCSNLCPTLNQPRLWDGYYRKNREARDPLHTDVCIFSPGIAIIKTDEEYPRRMDEKDWATVDVISCAAPNLRPVPGNRYNPESDGSVEISAKALYNLHLRRAKAILGVAADNGEDALILGAFGCGAFMNDPAVVAEAWRDAVEDLGGYFRYLEFAVYCRSAETVNYDVFRATMKHEPKEAAE